MPGTSFEFKDIFPDPGGDQTISLLNLAQAMYIESGNDVLNHEITYRDGGELWSDAVFLSASQMTIDVGFTCKWQRVPKLLTQEGESDARGGLEVVGLILGQGVDQLSADNDGENPDDSCGPIYVIPRQDAGPWPLPVLGTATSAMEQGPTLRVRMVIQTGELWLLGTETCAGSIPPASQSTIDVEEVDYPFFQRPASGSTPGGLYVNGVRPNDKEVLTSGPSFLANSTEPIFVWEAAAWGWIKLNDTASTTVTGSATSSNAPMCAVSESGKKFLRWILTT